MPQVQALADKLGSSTQFVSAAIDDPEFNGEGPAGYNTPQEFVTTARLTMPTILTPRERTDADWNLRAVPTAYFIDSGGKVVDSLEAPFTIDDLARKAAMVR
jgi:hypothetical protein